MKYVFYIRCLTPIFIVGYILWQALIATNSLAAITNFQERTAFFDMLLPAGRVERTTEGIKLLTEPVYIDVRLPIRAKSVALELKVTDTSAPIKVGWQSDDDFVFDFSQATSTFSPGVILYHYDVKEINYLQPGHRGRFIISVPTLVPGSVLLKEATVSINREPVSFNWWQQLFSNLYGN